MAERAIPSAVTRASIDRLHDSVRGLLGAIRESKPAAGVQWQARADSFLAIANLLKGLKMLWDADEADEVINKHIEQIEGEIAACLQELETTHH